MTFARRVVSNVISTTSDHFSSSAYNIFENNAGQTSLLITKEPHLYQYICSVG